MPRGLFFVWLVWVYIRCFGCCGLGFRPYGGSLLANAPKVTKNACSYVRPARWGSGFLRSGIDPGAASTVGFAAPPLAVFGFAKRSLRSHARINPCAQPSDVARGSRSRAAVELTLILLSGGRACGRLLFGVGFTPHPSPQPSPEGEGADFWAFQNQSSARNFMSAHLSPTPLSVPSLFGRGRG
ncbi:hypothetical protein SAMN04490189_1605 [Pseudomonas koreensis]|nr:hypothetical protein SAMN04490189_1605 [Pseudomonas koreensis]